MRYSVTRSARRIKARIAPPSRVPRLPDTAAQLALALAYRRSSAAALGGPLSDYGFSCYSQTDEDGILLYIFSLIGTGNRQCVEMCAGDGIECNTANLIINHGWHGLLVDGDAEHVARGRRFYAESMATRIYPPRLVQAWVTRDGVNDIVRSGGFAGEVDLLSLDLDGIDYWIWAVIDAIDPRVVVLEYQDILGPARSWTVPYSDDFCAGQYSMTQSMPNFAGASLSAFVKLGRSKGYRLVGVNRYGFNAFFVREDLGVGILPEVDVESCFTHPKVLAGMRDRFPLVANMPWVEV
jgi:hypothetical protein